MLSYDVMCAHLVDVLPVLVTVDHGGWRGEVGLVAPADDAEPAGAGGLVGEDDRDGHKGVADSAMVATEE